MPHFDTKTDITPAIQFPSTTQGGKFPTIAALKAAISGSPQAASYPADTLQTMTKNDLIYICRLHSIACVGV